MTSLSSDQALVDGLNAGRHDAFERLYGDHHAGIYNLCARIVGDREEAKDLTQEVFITAFRNPPAAHGRAPKIRAWLYRVATNACFNHLRSRDRLGGDATDIDAARAPVDEYERAQTAALVEESLREMNERYRTALVLKDLHGLPAAEIADVMSVSRPAADVLVHRARASFRSVFTRLAGDKAAAPASLGLVLLPLGVPAGLSVIPTLPAPLGAVPHAPGAPAHATPTPHVPATAHPAPTPHVLPMPDLSATAGPAGAGLLAKLGSALTTKIGITAAAATLAVGGGTAIYEMRVQDAQHGAAAETHQNVDGEHSGAGSEDGQHEGALWSERSHWAGHGWPPGEHHGHWDSHSGTWVRQTDGHTGGAHGTTADSGHATTHDDGTTTSHNGTTTSTTHDGSTSTSSPTHDGATETTGTHDAGAD